MYVFTQPLHMGKMWSKVNFRMGFNRLRIQNFLSPKPVAMPGLQSTVCPTIYPWVEGEWLDVYISQGYKRDVKGKQSRSEFKLELPNSFPNRYTMSASIIFLIFE